MTNRERITKNWELMTKELVKTVAREKIKIDPGIEEVDGWKLYLKTHLNIDANSITIPEELKAKTEEEYKLYIQTQEKQKQIEIDKIVETISIEDLKKETTSILGNFIQIKYEYIPNFGGRFFLTELIDHDKCCQLINKNFKNLLIENGYIKHFHKLVFDLIHNKKLNQTIIKFK